MEFFRRVAARPRVLGVLPGTFNPPTRAHVALARAALASVDEVVFVLPREFPHKGFEGASFEERLRMLEAALACEPSFSIAASSGGLFIEIARECREAYGAGTGLYFLCGRDAAERIVNWDYGREGAINEQLSEYELLVAPRQGGYEVPEPLRGRIHAMGGGDDVISASEVRRRIRAGEAWEELVPEPIVEMVRLIFQPRL